MRAITDDDVERVHELFAAYDLADLGEIEFGLGEVAGMLQQPGYQGWAVEGPAGRFDGMAAISRPRGQASLGMEVRQRPGVDARVLEPLVTRCLETAVELAADRPVHAWVCDHDEGLRGVLAGSGGTVVREFLRMAVDVADLAAPEPGPGVTVRGVRDEDADLRVVKAIRDEGFADHYDSAVAPYDEWLTDVRTRGDDLTLWWLASVDGEPASALRASANDAGDLWVQNLATRRDSRGRGLGRLLLLTAGAEVPNRGGKRLALAVDGDNPTGAVQLYRSIGMQTEHCWVTYEWPPATAPSR